uniref:Transport permease protein n=1 Tax=Streptomyces sp. CNQ-418 TaxID=467194 RepID=J7H3R3_9ACTN|nr:ABC transporter [Streptomyces sp. CNQ-418]
MLSTQRTRAIAQRVIREILREPRSRVLTLVTPGILILVVRQLFASAEEFNATGVLMLGVMPVFSLYLVGSTTIVQERTKGTLESVLITPAQRSDLIAGYVSAALLIAAAQAMVATTVAYTLCGLSTASPPWVMALLATVSGAFGMSLGLLVSVISENEGQAFQFLPAVMIPQTLLSGLVWPVSEMAGWAQGLESVLPISAVTRALSAAEETNYGGGSMWLSVLVLLCLIIAILGGSVSSIRRQVA